MNEFPRSNLILRLIKEKCKLDGITQKQLCYGICDTGYISRCINQNTEVDKLMLDAFMQRLGMSVRSYKYILRDSEYKCFTIREKIRMCISEYKIQEANTLVEEYLEMQTEMKGAKKLHHQMALLLRSYVLGLEDADPMVQMKNIDEAIACTIAEIRVSELGRFLFSEVELLLLTRKAMLLENMGKEDEAYILYYHLYHIQKGKTYATDELTYIFVVVDYHLAKICLRKKEFYSARKIAEKGIESLSKNNKFLFAGELLEIISLLAEDERISEKRTYKYELIKKLILKYMPDWNPDTYYPLYREFSVYSFRKMIVQRRKMLGLTQEELSVKCCCDIATIERMEQGLVDTQSDIAYQILNAVGLPIEKCFYLLQTSSYDVKQKDLKLATAINENRLEEAKHLLSEIRESIDMSLVINQQVIAFEESIIYHSDKNISAENRIQDFMTILNYTIPKEAIGKSDVILYENEVGIIRSIAMCYEKAGDSESGIKLLEWGINGFLKENSVGEENDTEYLVLLKLLESIYANQGDFEIANQMLKIGIPGIIKSNIAGFVPQFIYDKAWNMLKEKGDIDEETEWELKAAYEIAKFSRVEWVAYFIEKICDSFNKKEWE